ncbi:hypothetical protein AO385_1986 [Moraxella catarrhalis]|uniref:Uncharacterized protein n=1 Tax=Moraxella catarrhalis TaxID=480 RepID=A0A198UDQ9_MORCA|nr:hypothetical protein AO384_1925 [Moraxella catarrhalis]OAU95562.1 hypothetical protein AO385_1986 [Moraxella catarrhalis]OAU96828.1 hypothetical protein AO383_1345 [Moraxella catarrhalis]OAV06072.1 hypothetical protein AO379_1148 [Moraxella catarrhalis]OAV18402.1 hypothetical protein AO373_0986 [Moraxella catarrhalis]
MTQNFIYNLLLVLDFISKFFKLFFLNYFKLSKGYLWQS